jgi:hypothetical protein
MIILFQAKLIRYDPKKVEQENLNFSIIVSIVHF